MVKFSLTVPKQTSSIAPEHVWSNKDTDPTTPEQRLWTHWTWCGYWISDIITVSGWQKASAMIALGLDWRQSLIITTLGSVLLAIPLVLNGKIGSTLHIPFPIAIRSSHGYYFSRFAVLSRALLAMFWFGIQSWNGGSAVRLMIGAIWPSFLKLHNGLPASAGTTTQSMVAFLIYFIIQFPFLFIHPSKLRYVFLVKSIVVPITALATMAWCIKKAGGGGALLHAGPTAHGEAYASAWLLSLTSLIGGYSTVALNIPDFTRYSKTPMSQYIQAPLLPLFYLITALFGIISASCTKSFSPGGKVLWSPLDIAALFNNRAAMFFASAAWCLAQISCNVSANSISAANDIATLFPKYFTIRRGQILTAFLGAWCMVPWKILASAKVFLNAISGYAIVLGPLAGVMCTDFYLVKKQHIDVPALYDPHGRYRFFYGTNWRCVVALAASIGPNLPGFINVIQPHIKIGAIKWIYSVSWIFGIIVSSIVYYLLSVAFPDKTGSLVGETTYAEDVWGGSVPPPSNRQAVSTPTDEDDKSFEKDEPVVSTLAANDYRV